MQETRLSVLLHRMAQEQGDSFACDEEAIALELAAPPADYSGWGIRLISIIGGILACVFLLGFLLLAGLYDSPAAMTVLGLVFTAGSVFANKIVHHPALEAASIAAYVAGYALIGFGMTSARGMEGDTDTIVLLFAVLAVATVLVTESFPLLFLPVLIFTGCCVTLILQHRAFDLVHLLVLIIAGGYTWLSLAEPELIAGYRWVRSRYSAIRAGFLFSLLGLVILLGQPTELLPYQFYFHWISSAILLCVFLAVVWQVMRSAGIRSPGQQVLIFLLGIVVLAPSLFAPAVLGSLLILVIGFHTSQSAAKSCGVLGLLWAVSRYYYDLNLSLLAKSCLMMASGVLYLTAYFILQRQTKSHEPQ